MSDLAGSVFWAVVPFVPQASYHLYAGPGHDPIEVAETATLIDAARSRAGADREFTFLTPAKLRPVLLLSGVVDRGLPELVALRLLRLEELVANERDRVRRGDEPLLFYLDPESHPGLREESAAMIGALVRLHDSAVDRRERLARLGRQELAVVGDRVIDHYGFDTRLLVRRALQELVERRRG